MGYNWGNKSSKWGYPNYNLLITLFTKSHEPVSVKECGMKIQLLKASSIHFPFFRPGSLRITKQLLKDLSMPRAVYVEATCRNQYDVI